MKKIMEKIRFVGEGGRGFFYSLYIICIDHLLSTRCIIIHQALAMHSDEECASQWWPCLLAFFFKEWNASWEKWCLPVIQWLLWLVSCCLLLIQGYTKFLAVFREMEYKQDERNTQITLLPLWKQDLMELCWDWTCHWVYIWWLFKPFAYKSTKLPVILCRVCYKVYHFQLCVLNFGCTFNPTHLIFLICFLY